MDRKMTLTNGASSGNAGVNPGGGFGFDAANLSASANMQILLQTNNDLILSIYKTIVDSTQEINRKIEALRDDIRDIKLNQQRNDRTLQEEATMWRTHTEQLLAGQGSRHLQDVSRLQDMLMKLVVAQPPQLSTSTGSFVTQEAVGGGFATSATAPVVTAPVVNAPAAAPVAIPLTAVATIQATTTVPLVTAIAPIITTAPSIVASTTPLSTTSPYTIHSAPSFTTTKPTFVTYTPAITTTTPTVTSTMSSTTTNTTFGVTGTVPFGGSLFGGGNNAGTNTFANLAAKAAQSKPGQAGGGFLSGNNGGISSDGSKQSLFGASPFSFFTPHTKTETRGDGDESDKEDETAEDYTPDVHYEPVVPLPPEVEVVSGEEGEEVTFVARCKLYRYDRQLKENKERGLGDIKILFNPTTKKYRCVMRREKVFKICANFPVVHDLSLHKREQMPTVYTWACKDFSEDTVGGLDETFTARFKDASIAEEFHQKMTEAIDAMQ